MYISTRNSQRVSASEAIIKGLAQGGGLFIFEELPSIKYNKDFLKLNYKETAFQILKAFLDDFTDDEITSCINNAYNDNDFKPEEVSFNIFQNYGFLNLYNGKTFAFKDMALSILPFLLEVAKKKNNVKEKTFILTATSGDTGSAALSGFSNTSTISTIVLYPNKAISRIQEAQMLSFNGKNARAIAIDGNFDDCQRSVKDIFNNVNIDGVSLSSANSINIGRLIPQIVYYVYTYSALVNKGVINYGDKINFSVPTGNFGNILACYIAKLIGTPINKIICASNKNNVLTDFFNKGVYDSNRKFYVTNSPSMDILVSSNLERLLYLISSDKSFVKEKMDELSKIGRYEIKNEYMVKLSDFIAAYADEEDTLAEIKSLYEKTKLVIDPHTSVAYHAYKQNNLDGFTVVVSTASPYKFPQTISSALSCEEEIDDFELIKKLETLTNNKADNRILELKNVKIDPTVWSKDDIKQNIVRLIGEMND